MLNEIQKKISIKIHVIQDLKSKGLMKFKIFPTLFAMFDLFYFSIFIFLFGGLFRFSFFLEKTFTFRFYCLVMNVVPFSSFSVECSILGPLC